MWLREAMYVEDASSTSRRSVFISDERIALLLELRRFAAGMALRPRQPLPSTPAAHGKYRGQMVGKRHANRISN